MRTAAENTTMVELRRAAMDLLARREHSRAELTDKLRRKFAEDADRVTQLLPAVLDQLEQDGLLSDARFVAAYVRYRRSRGFGPLLIRQELRGKGVSSVLLDAALAANTLEWLESLRELVARKQRLPTPEGDAQAARKARQKLYRFCLSRGFSSEQIEQALRPETG
ncbi:MAG: regulatory protein RecX [Gammaproteobacteria bacterium]|nr:regulatory protein RecX [Gammaproteobacteria bacterium]